LKNENKKYKAVGLLSGGLDSAVAAKMIMDQGIEVYAVTIAMPWGCGEPSRVVKFAEKMGVPLKVIPLADDYLSILTKPKYGFGSAHNPCIDCHIYMVKKAAEYMREIGASFVFTGEVLGQRPMSQRRKCLDWVEQDGGIPGRLLRPLSAKLLPPTIPEEEGIVDREKLLDISGRARRQQYDLALALGVHGFSSPGGGCLLTEKLFGERLKDALKYGCRDIASSAVLGIGRYFRVDESTFVILGRDQGENEKLIKFAMPEDVLLQPTVFPGPVALLRSKAVTEAHVSLAAGISQFYSKSKGKDPLPLSCWRSDDPARVQEIIAGVVNEKDIRNMLL
jgi:tRNA U34 2-thiouridine synthase MnmA/TrmU